MFRLLSRGWGGSLCTRDCNYAMEAIKRSGLFSLDMVISKPKLIYVALCSFSIGIWTGYYLRRSLNKPAVIVQRHLLGAQHGSIIATTQARVAVHATVEPFLRDDRPFIKKDPKTCLPHANVMFLKTHKTASSAVQNVMLRYANKNNLTVGLSNLFDIRFHYGRKFHHSYVAPTVKPINMLCHHMVFNYPEVKKVMPEDTFYFTIIREPGSLFESLFDYMHYDVGPFRRVPKGPNALEMWLNHSSQLFRGRNDGSFWWFAKNGMFFDMGYDNLIDDDKYIQQAIAQLDEVFDLVLISDYFEESMLLLKDHLCWSISDILALKTNARATYHPLNERVRKKVYEWNKADAMIYQHFTKKFWEKVDEYGRERMKKDLETLRLLNAKLQSGCIDGEAVSNKYIKMKANKVYNPRGVVMKGYNLKETAMKNQTCINLIKGEIQWTREMMARNNRTKLKH